ncbi:MULTISPECIES: protein jag [unclassified Pyramidobacter]|uniref:Jag family protein n=1 Tax=unclassified Pyramidobacter TaxID=2632171 RepID=UPI0025D72BBF|nr:MULTISPECIES: R3H domain-containing nucleic acid-binding protein [unclassified Pyramidobacter]MCI7402836.1 Jag N-terminal domain-containing protein [Pyramidobacter sp.]MDY3212227.1 R3H domain-containing nucleic acid-binding protein [Pyramidobacter sp.]WOL39331.1 R3H domain-containing nucleic acid-binding protein [Pyramidobacter sp. YE332]
MEENILKTQDDEVLVLEVSSEDEARDRAASRWNIAREDVLLTVVGEEKKLFGLFGRKLKVEARRPAAPAAGPAKAAEADGGFVVLLERVLKAAGLDLEVNVQSDGSVNLSGPDSRILLAGRQGEGLKALDYIVNLMARNDGPVPHVRIDCEGFRRKREKDLERIAMDAAKEAMKTRRTVYLQPMSSWERRIVHLTLRESANVETHSIGVEPGRKVAVRLISGGRPERRYEDEERRERPDRQRGERSGSRRPRRRRSHRSDASSGGASQASADDNAE